MSTPLQGKHILLGISGSIAAYKAAMLVRLLVKAGADVQVLMTADTQAFITSLTLSSLPDTGAGFYTDTNKVSVFLQNNKRFDFELKSKQAVAEDILDILVGLP